MFLDLDPTLVYLKLMEEQIKVLQQAGFRKREEDIRRILRVVRSANVMIVLATTGVTAPASGRIPRTCQCLTCLERHLAYQSHLLSSMVQPFRVLQDVPVHPMAVGVLDQHLPVLGVPQLNQTDCYCCFFSYCKSLLKHNKENKDGFFQLSNISYEQLASYCLFLRGRKNT